MTSFDRRGHWRTSSRGRKHWVSETEVYRDEWERSGGAGSGLNAGHEFAHGEGEISRTRAWCFITPNARCPVCGDLVFFYQNEFGSRVFFDDLAPDWPKHPCTDVDDGGSEAHSAPIFWTTEPQARSFGEIEELHDRFGEWVPEVTAGGSQGALGANFSAMRIRRRLCVSQGVALILEGVERQGSPFRFLVCRRLPRGVRVGALVWLKRRSLSFFDLIKMQAGEVEVQGIRGAARFIAELVS